MEDIKKFCVVSCPISTRSGYGSRSRDFVRALIELKPNWDIKILSQRWGSTPMDALKDGEDNDLLDRVLTTKLDKKPDVWIQITVPNEFQRVGEYNIGVTAGVETTVMPPDCLEGINRMDLTMVSSTFTKDVIQSSIFDKKDQQTQQTIGQLKLEKPVEVLFEGIDLEVYNDKAPSEPRIDSVMNEIKESFAFLFVGHWLPGDMGEDRKNVSGLIYTFLKSFKNKRNAPALILKTSVVSTSLLDRIDIKNRIENIRNLVQMEDDTRFLPNIYLLHSDLTDYEMNALYNHPKVKAHVSFTKGEGFGRPLLEATISGKPMIVSGWSGHMDFIQPNFVSVIAGQLTDVHPSATNNFLLKEGQWFTIEYGIAMQYMVDIFENYKKYLELSRKHRKFTKDNFSFEKMIEKLDTLIDESKIKSAPKVLSLNLPKLKKVESEQPKITLPKLKKVE